MDIPVLVEKKDGGGFVACCWFGVSAEGETEADALAKVWREVERRLQTTATLRTISVPDGGPVPPLIKWAGTWDLNDPRIIEWQQAVEEHRRARDLEDTPW